MVSGENNKVGESGSRGGHKVGGRKGWEGVVCKGVGAGKGRGRRKGGTGRGEWSQCCQMPDLGHLTLKPTSKLIIETHLPDHTITRN